MAYVGYDPDVTGYQPGQSRFQGYRNPLGFEGQANYNYSWGDPMWQQFFERLKQRGVSQLAGGPSAPRSNQLRGLRAAAGFVGAEQYGGSKGPKLTGYGQPDEDISTAGLGQTSARFPGEREALETIVGSEQASEEQRARAAADLQRRFPYAYGSKRGY